jgi:hypothetical protein
MYQVTMELPGLSVHASSLARDDVVHVGAGLLPPLADPSNAN